MIIFSKNIVVDIEIKNYQKIISNIKKMSKKYNYYLIGITENRSIQIIRMKEITKKINQSLKIKFFAIFKSKQNSIFFVKQLIEEYSYKKQDFHNQNFQKFIQDKF